MNSDSYFGKSESVLFRKIEYRVLKVAYQELKLMDEFDHIAKVAIIEDPSTIAASDKILI